jgi:hypothetical protein
MTESLSDQFLSLLDFKPISRIRRNHGLEHATLHVLVERQRRRALAGHSNLDGFWIIGEVSTEELDSAVREALQRLRGGERELAVHPTCGTNFVVAGVMAGAGAALAMFGAGRRLRDKLERLPLAITVSTLALIAAQPLGLTLQEKVTTSGDPGEMEVVEVVPAQLGNLTAHRVVTHG